MQKSTVALRLQLLGRTELNQERSEQSAQHGVGWLPWRGETGQGLAESDGETQATGLTESNASTSSNRWHWHLHVQSKLSAPHLQKCTATNSAGLLQLLQAAFWMEISLQVYKKGSDVVPREGIQWEKFGGWLDWVTSGVISNLGGSVILWQCQMDPLWWVLQEAEGHTSKKYIRICACDYVEKAISQRQITRQKYLIFTTIHLATFCN